MNKVQEQIDKLDAFARFADLEPKHKLCARQIRKSIDTMEAMHQENKELHEQVAVLQSKEVCTAPHDDSIIDGCPYCRLEALLKENKRLTLATEMQGAAIKRLLKRQELLEKAVEALDVFQSRLDKDYEGWPVGGPAHCGDWEELRQLKQARAALKT